MLYPCGEAAWWYAGKSDLRLRESIFFPPSVGKKLSRAGQHVVSVGVCVTGGGKMWVCVEGDSKRVAMLNQSLRVVLERATAEANERTTWI